MVFFQDTLLGQENPVDTVQNIPVKVDTVWVEKSELILFGWKHLLQILNRNRFRRLQEA
jgi:hypothetical protein